MRKRLHVLISLLVLIGALAVQQAEPLPLQRVRMIAYDTLQRLKPRVYEPAGVRIVDLDDESLHRIGQWPWPRTKVAELVARLNEAGAAVVAFDVVFSEPDRTSPRALLPLWQAAGGGEGLAGLADRLPDHDAVLAGEIAKLPVVAGFTFVPRANAIVPTAKLGFATNGDDPLLFLPDPFRGAVVNLPGLTAAAAGNGAFDFFPDHDGILRRVPLLFRFGRQLFPSLDTEVLRVAQGASTVVVKSSNAQSEMAYGEQAGIAVVKIGAAEVPTDRAGRVLLYDTGSVPDRFVPAWTLFEPGFDRRLVENQVVFIGTSAAGLLDLRSTPLNPAMPGVEVHAQLLEQVALEQYLYQPGWMQSVDLTYVLLVGLLLILLVEVLGALSVALIGALAVVIPPAASWIAFSQYQILLDPVAPAASLLMVYLSASLVHFFKTEREKRFVRGAFARYLSPQLVEQLANAPDRLQLGGEMREMTLMFCDIRGFTTISERYDPQGLTRLINGFLTPMTTLILDRRGTIDKYIGDCIMAFWNAPLDDAAHARHGCASALAMIEALPGLNQQWAAEAAAKGQSFLPLAIGIGLNTGEACVGNMGSDQRFDYSVLGDTVNLASRLEGQSKPYGVSIVISETTRSQVADFACLELDLIKVKGKTRPVRIFTLLGDAALAQAEDFRRLHAAHERMLAAYRRQDWGQAEGLIGECRALSDGRLDHLYDLYEERLAAYRAAPPPAEWDGVYTATSK